MKTKNPPRIFTFLFYAHWAIDLMIAVVSLLFVVIILIASFKNYQMADLWNLVFSLIALLYGVANFLIKINDNLRESEALEIEAINIFENCKNITLLYYPRAEEHTRKVEEKVLNTYLDDWKKHQNIKPLEYQMMDSYLNHIVSGLSLDEGDKLFLKYRIVSSTMTSYFPLLVSEVENGDYFTPGTVHNKFIKKIYLLSNESDVNEAKDLVLDNEAVQDTINYALKKSNPVMDQLLEDKKSKEKIHFLLNKCYENAYSNIGNLDKELRDDSKRNLIVMFKYDERFSIPKRQWHTVMKSQLAKKYAKQGELEEAYGAEVENLKKMMTPQPFSRAIQDFNYCIERLAPKEHFLYAIYSDRFGAGTKGWSVEKFMKERVILRAKEYLKDFNKKFVRKYPYLKKYQKRTIDANYYLFHFNRQYFEYFADQDSIPVAIKRFLVKSVLESEHATDHLASQLVYVKQVIRNITISGLLFTESFELQNGIQEHEGEILKKARKKNLIISNIYEIASIGNQINLLIQIVYETYFGKNLKRKTGKNYSFAKGTTETIVENAKEIIQVFESLKTSTTV
jgi:hypothetical protein